MSKGLGPHQKAVMRALIELWTTLPAVRIAEPGMSPKERFKLMRIVERLEKRGLLKRVRLRVKDRWGRDNIATFATLPNAAISDGDVGDARFKYLSGHMRRNARLSGTVSPLREQMDELERELRNARG